MTVGGGWAFDPADLTRTPLARRGRRRSARPLLPVDSLGARLAALGVSVVLAYHYSLLTLGRDLGLDTPLAYLGLVPFMAVGIALLAPRRPAGPDIHDRQVDLIVGLPLVAAALFAQAALPGRLGSNFWLYRVDLLTLPVFVAGCVALLFGVRALARFWVPVAFLVLAWPVPYAWLIEHVLGATTTTTLAGIRRALHVVHVAVPTVGGDGSVFTIVHGGVAYQVDVASSCSGVNSIVGFALVGGAFAAVVRGARARKAAWLALGLVLVWALNIGRIVTIFWAGRLWGERVAVDGLHPVLGLVVFAGAVVAMVCALPVFRLRIGDPVAAPAVPLRARLSARPRAAHGMRLAGVTLAVAAVLLAGLDGALTRFELTAGDFGAARVTAFDQHPSVVPGFSASPVASYAWVTRFFGGGSSWQRLEYTPTSTFGGTRVATPMAPVIADVIDSKSIEPFNSYGIEACYQFHGYSVHGEHEVDLGGVLGHALTYRDRSRSWNVVYWIWVVDAGAGHRRYERVVLLQPTGGATGAQPQDSPLQGVGYGSVEGGKATSTADAGDGTGLLVDFARQAVAHAVPVASAPAVNAAGAAR
jgi:exosortase/archaeosortase family protein